MASSRVIALVGAEFEENLSLRYLASAVMEAGFAAEIIALDDETGAADLATKVLACEPLVVGLSVPFQHLARQALGLATELRSLGYRGHIVVGGHFATFEYEAILREFPAVDSVARHEGERTLVELCELVRGGAPVGPIPGLVVRGRRARLPMAGAPANALAGPKRPLPPLDELPFPDRRGEPHDVLGIPCAPLVGSRGCYADCSFCCIFAYADNAEGARYRMRSPESIVREMKELYDERNVRLFVFHDDNFFVPHAPKNLARYRRLDQLMREAGIVDVGLVIKCRPNDVDAELFTLLREMGMIRAYVGIETSSGEGIVSLNRRITEEDNRRALHLLRDLDVYSSFNVLLFDPEATLEGVEKNLAFMEEFAEVPFNFCRAEVYAGTPLKTTLEAEGRLRGDYLAWNYEMKDPRVELLFRVATTAFYARNFKSDGIANLDMGIRFDHEVLRRFYPAEASADLAARMRAFSRDIGLDTVAHVREAVAFVRAADLTDVPAANAFTLSLARSIGKSDLRLLGEAKRLRRALDDAARAGGALDPRHRTARLAKPWAAETARLGTSTGRDASTEILPAPASFPRS